VLESGTTLPATRSCQVTTLVDYQTSGHVQVFYGDHHQTRNNTLVDGIRLTGISPRKKGELALKLTLTVDVQGQVTLQAKEVPSEMVWDDTIFRRGIRK